MPQFIIIAADFIDAQANDRRLQVRQQHLDRMRNEKLKGIFIVGGATLNSNGDMNGSMLIINIDNIAAAESWVKQDPYVINKVWENIEIKPFRIAPV